RLPRDPAVNFVKRVVGLPGDRVQMHEGRLHVNDKMLPLRRDGIGEMELESGAAVSAPRFVETLPNGREHPIFKFRRDGDLDNTDEIQDRAAQLFDVGDNHDDTAHTRLPPAPRDALYTHPQAPIGP